MPDADVQITAGTGTKIDTRTVGGGSDEHRQVIVVGDPTTAANVTSVTSNGELVIGGNVAHDAVDSGNPVKIGGKATADSPAAVGDGDRVNAWFTQQGALAVASGPGWHRSAGPTALSANDAAITLATKGAGTARFQITATTLNFSTIVNIEGSVDGGTTWQGMLAYLADSYASLENYNASDLVAGNSLVVPCAGTTHVRLRLSNYGSGSITFVGEASAAGSAYPGVAITAGNLVDAAIGAGEESGALRVTVANDSTGRIIARGDVAHDAVDSGNPVKIGGKASSTAPTAVASGDRVDGWFSIHGAQMAGVLGPASGAGGDGFSQNSLITGASSGTYQPIGVSNYVFNGTNWDRFRTVGGGDGAAATGIAAAGLMGYNGTTWDRVRTANTGRLQVDVVTGGGGGTQYAEDAALGATPTGTLAVARRYDDLSTLTPVEDDAVGVRVDARGALWTKRAKRDYSGTFNGANQTVDFDTADADVIVWWWGASTWVGGANCTVYGLIEGGAGDGSYWVNVYNESNGTWGQTITIDEGYHAEIYCGPFKRIRVKSPASYTSGSAAWTAAVGRGHAKTNAVRLQGGTPEAPSSVSLASFLPTSDGNTINTASLRTAAVLLGYNGSTFDRVRVANTGRLQVDVVTGGGGGTQYAEDAALGAAGTGTLALARRDDLLDTLVEAENDAVGLRVNSGGALAIAGDRRWTTLSIGAAGSTSAVDVTGATLVGLSLTVPSGEEAYIELTWDDPSSSPTWYRATPPYVQSFQSGAANWTPTYATQNGNQSVLVQTNGARALRLTYVSGPGTITARVSPQYGPLLAAPVGDAFLLNNAAVPTHARVALGLGGSVTNWRQINEVQTTGAGTPSAGLVGQRDDTATAVPSEDAYASVRISQRRAILVEGVASGTAQAVGGDVAHDGVDSGNPVKFGGVANSSAPTAVADGDRVNAWFNPQGAQVISITNVGGASDGVTLAPVQIQDAQSTARNFVVQTVPYLHNGTNFSRIREAPSADGVARTGLVSSGLLGFNGTTWDRLRTIEAFDTASSTPRTGILAAGQPDRRYSSVNLGTAVNNVQSWQSNGLSEFVVRVGTSTTGTFTFEVDGGGGNWVQASIRDVQTGLWVTSITPNAGNVYRVITPGWHQVRARTTATLGTTVALQATGHAEPSVLNAIDTAPAPHRIGYAIASATAQYTTTQTSTVLGPTVTSSQRIQVTSIQIQAGGTTAGAVQVYLGTGAYSRGTNPAIFDGEFAPSATLKPGYAQSPPVPYQGALDQEVRVTTSAAVNPLTVTIWYYLV